MVSNYRCSVPLELWLPIWEIVGVWRSWRVFMCERLSVVSSSTSKSHPSASIHGSALLASQPDVYAMSFPKTQSFNGIGPRNTKTVQLKTANTDGNLRWSALGLLVQMHAG